MIRRICMTLSVVCLWHCSQLHHIHIGEIDNRRSGRYFDIKVNETGLNLDEAVSIAKSLTTSEAASEDLQKVRDVIALFQMGPRTGNMVFNQTYADNLQVKINEQCPTGRVTGLTILRESTKYPVISGEIVRVIGYCLGG